jgi:glycosyltransferase involved in cell wall biosynthesis
LLPRLAEAAAVQPRLLTLQGRGDFFEEIAAAGVPAACANLRARTDIAGLRHALRLAQPNPAIVVSQGVDALIVGALIARRARAVHVVVEHGGPGLPRRLHRRLLTRVAARSVDSVVAVSRSQLPDLRALGYPAARTQVIANGVEPVRPARGRNDVRAEFGVSGDEFLAVFVGGLRPPKRPAAFVDAVAAAGLRGLVVGAGPLQGEVDAAIARTGNAVEAVGERTDVADILCAADAACLVSDLEALPMMALEAMSARLPVVASDVGGVREAVVDGETGLLVPQGDLEALVGALHSLAGTPALARRLGEAGQARYEALFSAERMADAYLELLEQLVAARGL